MSADPQESDLSSPVATLSVVAVTPTSATAAAWHAEAFRRYYKELQRMLRRKASGELAQEIATRAFAKLLERPLGTVTQPWGYLCATANNLLANHYRDQDTHQAKEQIFVAPELEQEVDSPELALLRDECRQVLREVVDGLPLLTQMALRWWMDELKPREIVARFKELRIKIKRRAVLELIEEGIVVCRNELKASEEPKEEGDE